MTLRPIPPILVSALTLFSVTAAVLAAVEDRRLPVTDAIRAEAIRSNRDPIGRPLPLGSGWTNMFVEQQFGSKDIKVHKLFWSGAWQVEQINAGHHLLPFLGIYGELDEEAIREMARALFAQVMAAVDRVHADPVLRRFWRQGELVPNRAHPHPWSAKAPAEYQDRDRWFLLDTSVDPARPWNNDTVLPVFAQAHRLRTGSAREWLVYAHSPLQDRKGIRLTIPELGEIMVDVPVGGAFYLVDQERSARRVGENPVFEDTNQQTISQ